MTLHFTGRDIERFMTFVVKLPGVLILPDGTRTSACWPWMGARSRGRGNKQWYGSFRVGKRVVRAHRFSCEAIKGLPCPPGCDRDHLCNFTLCVNPEHIEVVLKQINQERRFERLRVHEQRAV